MSRLHMGIDVGSTTVKVVVLDEKTTSDVRQDLFNRINTTGVKASDSEIRRGSYPGKFTSFIESFLQKSRRLSKTNSSLLL